MRTVDKASTRGFIVHRLTYSGQAPHLPARESPTMSTARRRIGRRIVVTAAAATTLFGAVLLAPQAFAAGEAVNVYPTTTSDSALVSRLSGKCLDVTDGSTANGNQPQ